MIFDFLIRCFSFTW